MIRQLKTTPPIPHMHKTRMRYRGPIESIKINSFKQDFTRDIIEIEKRTKSCRNALHQYMSETLLGSDDKVQVMVDGQQVFECSENVKNSKILSNALSSAFVPAKDSIEMEYWNELEQ